MPKDKKNNKEITKKDKINKIINIFLIIFGIMIVIGVALYLNKKYEETTAISQIKFSTLKSDDVIITNNDEIKRQIAETQMLYYNEQIIALLSIDNIDEVMPIPRASNNKYYLTHSLSQTRSIVGSIFMDYRHSSSSRQINLYGHNSDTLDTPFKKLENYINKDYFDEHKTLSLKIDNEERKYEIFSVYIASKKDSEEHMQFEYKSDDEWNNHFNRMKKRSLYDTNVDINGEDNILVLQTCLYGKYKDKLIIISGKEIK